MRFNSTDKCVSDGPRERAVPLASFEFSRNVACVVGVPTLASQHERMKHVNGVSLLWGVYAGCSCERTNTVCFSR